MREIDKMKFRKEYGFTISGIRHMKRHGGFLEKFHEVNEERCRKQTEEVVEIFRWGMLPRRRRRGLNPEE